MGERTNETVERGSTSLALKAGVWYFVSTFLLKGVAFITTPLFARLMSTNDYGEFANYTSWQSTLLIITGLELYSTLGRAYYDYKDDYNKYVSSMVVLTIVIEAAFYLVFLICGNWIHHVITIPHEYIHIMFFTMMCASWKTLFMTRERTLYQYKKVALISAIDVIIPTLISVILVLCVKENGRLSARIYGFYVPSAIVGIFCATSLWAKEKPFSISHCKYAIVLAVPILVQNLAGSLMASTNVTVAKALGSAEDSAIVSMATTVNHILYLLFTAVSGAVTTWVMDNLEQKKEKKLRKQLRVYFLALTIVSCGVILLSPEAIMILGGKKFVQSIELIPPMIIYVFIQTITAVFAIVLTYDKNVVKTGVLTCIVSGISIAAKLFVYPIVGIDCLAWINVGAYLLLLVGNYYLVHRAGYTEILDMKFYILMIGILAVLTVSSRFLFKHTIIRYGIIVIIVIGMVIAAWKERDVLRKFFVKKETDNKG